MREARQTLKSFVLGCIYVQSNVDTVAYPFHI